MIHDSRIAAPIHASLLLGLLIAVAPRTAHASGLPRKSTLGIAVMPVRADSGAARGLAAGVGVEVRATLPGSMGAKAGLRAGDWIVTLDGAPLPFAGFTDSVAAMKAGRRLRLGVLRGASRLEIRAEVVERPREPDNDVYTVVYDDVVSHGHRMRTIATHPRSAGRHPALLFIQGYSPISYDYFLDGPGLDAPILRDMARSGFVTLRVDKPGVGDSEGGPFSAVDFVTEADIYRQALLALRALADVDTSRVFIFGHSMGGAFGPLIASEIPVRGIVVYGVESRTWHEYLLDITRYQGLLAGKSYAQVDDDVRHQSRAMELVFQDHRTPDEVKRDHPELGPAVDETFPGGLFNGKTSEFWSQLENTNFAALWEKVNTHVLAVHGASDFVTYAVDHQLIADIVNRAHPGWGRFETVPASDHVFSNWATEAESLQHFPTGTFNPAFTALMKDWMASVGDSGR